MGLTGLQVARFNFAQDMLLEYTNDKLHICDGFNLPVDSTERVYQGLRISFDVWESPAMAEAFAREMKGCCDDTTYKTISAFRHSLRGPFYIAECKGQEAWLLYEDTIFKVLASRRTWDEMVPYKPDMIYTTLHPFERNIVAGQFLLHHESPMYGPGKERLHRTYQAALEKGVVTHADEFCELADSYNEQRRLGMMEPNSGVLFMDYVESINALLETTCVPYEVPECEIPVALYA